MEQREEGRHKSSPPSPAQRGQGRPDAAGELLGGGWWWWWWWQAPGGGYAFSTNICDAIGNHPHPRCRSSSLNSNASGNHFHVDHASQPPRPGRIPARPGHAMPGDRNAHSPIGSAAPKLFGAWPYLCFITGQRRWGGAGPAVAPAAVRAPGMAVRPHGYGLWLWPMAAYGAAAYGMPAPNAPGPVRLGSATAYSSAVLPSRNKHLSLTRTRSRYALDARRVAREAHATTAARRSASRGGAWPKRFQCIFDVTRRDATRTSH